MKWPLFDVTVRTIIPTPRELDLWLKQPNKIRLMLEMLKRFANQWDAMNSRGGTDHCETTVFYRIIACIATMLTNHDKLQEGLGIEMPSEAEEDFALVQQAFNAQGWDVTSSPTASGAIWRFLPRRISPYIRSLLLHSQLPAGATIAPVITTGTHIAQMAYFDDSFLDVALSSPRLHISFRESKPPYQPLNLYEIEALEAAGAVRLDGMLQVRE